VHLGGKIPRRNENNYVENEIRKNKTSRKKNTSLANQENKESRISYENMETRNLTVPPSSNSKLQQEREPSKKKALIENKTSKVLMMKIHLSNSKPHLEHQTIHLEESFKLGFTRKIVLI
jgi:hypothetical protein